MDVEEWSPALVSGAQEGLPFRLLQQLLAAQMVPPCCCQRPAGWVGCLSPHPLPPISPLPPLTCPPAPQQDKFLKFKYDASTVEAGKAFAKSELQREAGLPVDPSVPVFGFIGGWQPAGCGRLAGHGGAVVLVRP